MRNIISVGECMVELARRSDDAFDMRVGGDTFNTAIYLARLGAPVSYMTAIGNDPYSARILSAARAEGVGVDNICIVNGRMPGLYLIETKAGERSFWYWRERSPARDLFELPESDELVGALANVGVIYLSGITLSLYSAAGLDQLEGAIVRARQNGTLVVMDGNYRPAGWQYDADRARRTYARFWRHTNIALPSFDDEQALWGDADPEATLKRLTEAGTSEICLKRGADGAIVLVDGDARDIAPEAVMTPIDSTAAGDSFSAAYLWARGSGHSAEKAATYGNRFAAIVIQHPGAIAPKSATANFAA
jgi:2-dehydro-3-deoxygluconokinase